MKKLWLFIIIFLQVACAAKLMPQEYKYDQEAYYQQQEVYADYHDYGGEGSGGGGYGFVGQTDEAMPMERQHSLSIKGYKKEAKKKESEEQAAPRMIHYNGYANLQVARPEEVIEEIVAISKEVDGNIERRSIKSITIRVPKESFADVFAAILEMGDVLSKSVTSEDVTEAFTSVELRLQTAKTTRDRLVALLEKTEDEKEKINILRQIQRLNEQIDVIEAQMRTLQNLADLSSISIELSARAAIGDGPSQAEPEGFFWIHELSPFQNTVCSSGKRLELETPEGLVSLHKKGAYLAESADGTVLRTTRLNNDPMGDAAFWQRAIHKRLKGGFGTVEQGSLGSFSTITLQEDSDNPYIWMIAVRNNGKDLELIEVYYPSKAQQERYQKLIEAAIVGGAQ